MAQVKLRDIRKSYGKVEVIKGVDIDIDDGEFVVFVGPSGCGKSTLLRMIAGLEDITSGTLEIDGKRVNDLEPSKRGIAMVFQSYAIFPHMTVRENVAFGLTINKVGKAEKDAKVVIITGREGRFSGGFDLKLMMSLPGDQVKALVDGGGAGRVARHLCELATTAIRESQ